MIPVVLSSAVRQAAEMTGQPISYQATWKLVTSGAIPAKQLPNGRYAVSPEAIVAAMGLKIKETAAAA